MAETQNIKKIVSSISDVTYKCINFLNNGHNENQELASDHLSDDLIQNAISSTNKEKIQFPTVMLIICEEFTTALKISLNNDFYEIAPINLEVLLTPDGAVDSRKYINMQFAKKKNKRNWFMTDFESDNQQSWLSEHDIETNFWKKLHANTLSNEFLHEYIYAIIHKLCNQSALDEPAVKNFCLWIPDWMKDYCNAEVIQHCISRIQKLRGTSYPKHIIKLLKNIEIMDFPEICDLYAVMRNCSRMPENGQELLIFNAENNISHGIFNDGEIITYDKSKGIEFNKTYAIGVLNVEVPDKNIPDGYYFFNSKEDIIRDAAVLRIFHEETNEHFKLNKALRSYKNTCELLETHKKQIANNNMIISKLESLLNSINNNLLHN